MRMKNGCQVNRRNHAYRKIFNDVDLTKILLSSTGFLNMNVVQDYEDYPDDDVIFYSVLYSCVTVLFGMAVLSKFLSNEFRFGFRSVLSLLVLFLGEPVCQFFVKGPGGVLTFAVCCLFIYSVLPASHLPVGNKAVLITGCDSGFGNALTKKLDSIGMRVYATCLHQDSPGAINLMNTCSDRVCVLQMNVTNVKEVDQVVDFVYQHESEEGLWGLVNNAGVWYFSEIETTTEELFSKVLDVNLFGAIRLTKRLLPLIRKAKGRIVNVSSLMGRVTMSGNGAYSVSKHALSAFSDTLRQEMRKWGVHVAIVEPTGYCTDNMKEHNILHRKEEIWNSLPPLLRETYGEDYINKIYGNIIEGSKRYPKDLTPVIRALRSGLLSKRPRDRYPCGTGAEFLMTIYPLLPVWIADKVSSAIGLMPPNNYPAALS